MRRGTGVVVGLAALSALALAVAPAGVGAGEGRGGEDGRRIEIFRGAGAWLGVVLEDVSSADVARLKLAEERGAVVKNVRPDSPAEKAGLQEGDVILRYQGESVASVAHLVRLVRETPAGRKVALEVSRGGTMQKAQATLERRSGDWSWADRLLDVPVPPIPPEPALPRLDDAPGRGRGRVLRDFLLLDRAPRKLGLEYQEISGQLAKYFRVPGDEGILVSSVDKDGPAGKAGLRAGDVLLKIDGKSVADTEDLRREVGRLSAGEEATITVQRDGKPMDVKVTVGGRREERPREGAKT